MLVLNAKEVYANAREAYARGELQAQTAPQVAGRVYGSYKGPCAIGVSVPVEMREDFDYTLAELYDGKKHIGNSITNLINEERVEADDIEALQRLQAFHDAWATSRLQDRLICEQRFLEVLNQVV